MEQGKVFVGPAGKLLREKLMELRIGPVWVTNVVECPTPGLRKPTAEEINLMQPDLWARIQAKSPRAVICLGETAVRGVMGHMPGPIMQLSGRRISDRHASLGLPVYAVFHPAAVLRNPRLRGRWDGDWYSVLSLLEQKADRPVPEAIQKVDDLDEFLGIVNGLSTISVDYETSGLEPQKGRILTVAVSDGKRAFWHPASAKGDQICKLIHGICKKNWVCHNAPFELYWSLWYGAVMPERVDDTMMLAHLIHEEGPHDLGSLAAAHLGVPPWDDEVASARASGEMEKVDLDVLGTYNAKDAFYTMRLFSKLRSLVPAESKLLYEFVLVDLLRASAQMRRDGIFIDRDWLEQLDEAYQERIARLRSALVESEPAKRLAERQAEIKTTVKDLGKEKIFVPCGHGPVPCKCEQILAFGKGLFVVRGEQEKVERRIPKPWNPDSPAQTLVLFRDILGLKLEAVTKEGNESVGVSSLQNLVNAPEIVTKYLEYKSLQMQRRTFITGVADWVHDNLVHPDARVAMTVAGRSRMADPPMQGIPDYPYFRGMVRSRYADGVILSADYSQLELRLVAILSGEEALLDAFRRGEDPHSRLAQRLFGPGYTKEQRGIAKNLNFGILYGAGPRRLSQSQGISFQQAKQLLDEMRRAYPAIERWRRETWEFALKNKKVVSFWGRVRHLPSLPDSLGECTQEDHRTLRQAANFLVQSMGADLTNRAMVLLWKEIRSKVGFHLIHQVHDAILLDIKSEEDAKGFAPVVKEIMERRSIGKAKLPIPLLVDITISKRWGGAESFRLPENWNA